MKQKGIKKFKEPEELGMIPGSRQYADQHNRLKPTIDITI